MALSLHPVLTQLLPLVAPHSSTDTTTLAHSQRPSLIDRQQNADSIAFASHPTHTECLPFDSQPDSNPGTRSSDATPPRLPSSDQPVADRETRYIEHTSDRVAQSAVDRLATAQGLERACEEQKAARERAGEAGHPTPAVVPDSAASHDARRTEVSDSRRRAGTLSALNRQAWSQPLSEARFKVQFTADAELLGKLKQAQALSRHPVRKDDIATVVDEALTLLIAKRQAERFGVSSGRSSNRTRERMAGVESSNRRSSTSVERDRSPTPSVERRAVARCADSSTNGGEFSTRQSNAPAELKHPAATAPVDQRAAGPATDSDSASGNGRESHCSPALTGSAGADRRASLEEAASKAQRSRYIPTAVRQEVARRDGMRCAFVAADGRRCEERHGLEFDHRHPYARGGTTSVNNLRLLCRTHNGLAAERDFGRRFIRARIDERRGATGPAAPNRIGARVRQKTIPES